MSVNRLKNKSGTQNIQSFQIQKISSKGKSNGHKLALLLQLLSTKIEEKGLPTIATLKR
jgi:hypothetical protein